MAQFVGTVRWFDNVKGYGFLGTADGPDVFVHYSAIQDEGYRTLRQGEPVEFDVVKKDRGLQADAVVRRAESTPEA